MVEDWISWDPSTMTRGIVTPLAVLCLLTLITVSIPCMTLCFVRQSKVGISYPFSGVVSDFGGSLPNEQVIVFLVLWFFLDTVRDPVLEISIYCVENGWPLRIDNVSTGFRHNSSLSGKVLRIWTPGDMTARNCMRCYRRARRYRGSWYATYYDNTRRRLSKNILCSPYNMKHRPLPRWGTSVPTKS